MEIKNHTLEMLKLRLDRVLEKRPDICSCDQCYLDILTLALNQLPSLYYTSRSGGVFIELKSMDENYKMKLTSALISAIKKVKGSPRHVEFAVAS